MSVETWEDLDRKLGGNTRLYNVPAGVNLRSLSKTIIPTLGIAYVNIYGKQVEFFVVKHLSHNMLLGDDALRILKARIFYEKDEIRLLGKRHIACVPGSRDSEMASVQLVVDKWVKRFPELFNDQCKLTKTDSVEMDMEMQPHPPTYTTAYRMPLKKRQVVDREIDKMLEDDIIEPSSSPWASPLVLVPKKDGQVRTCVDYRKVNSLTQRDPYPLPSIDDIFDSMTGANVFSTLDLRSGYWQIPMAESSKDKTAFICHRGLYQFKRMPFGLRNAPAVFQRFMNKVLAPFLGRFCCVYLDDIVVFSKTQEEHEGHLQQIFTVLQEHNLKLKPGKCHLQLTRIKLLGYIISKDGKRSDPEKVEALSQMAWPTTVKQVRSFLGLSGYYRSLIPNYAKIAGPLNKLLRKHVRFDWGPEQEKAWTGLRDELISDRIMAYPQPDKPYKLYCDACDYAVGAILVQDDENGIERPIQYISKQLHGNQLSWPVIEKEGFGVMFAIKKLQPYLHGAEFTIFTDHKPLKSLLVNQNRNLKVQRWSIALAEMGAEIKYREGRNNIRADTLSRLKPQTPTQQTPERTESSRFDDEVLQTYEDINYLVASIDFDVKQEDQCESTVMEIHREGNPGIPWDFDELEVQHVIHEQQQMPEYQQGENGEHDFVISEGLLYTLRPPPGKTAYPRLVLPPSTRFRVIRRAHQEVGHQGMRKTIERLQEHYKWPGQRRDVFDVIHKCARCQVHTGRRERPPPTYMPVAQYPCQIVGMDLTGPFITSTEGNRYVLTVIDHCTGWAEAKPIPGKSAKYVLKYLEQEYVPRHGAPEVLICDNGKEFKNHLVVPYLQALGTDVRHANPYHPQSNSKVERFHKTLKALIRKLVNSKASQWENCLGPALWAHRVSTSVVTGYSPYFGRHPITPKQKLLSRPTGTGPELLAERLDELSAAFKEAARNTEESRVYNMARLQKRANAGELAVGDHVCVYANDRSSLDARWDHGYVVTRIRGPVITVIGPQNRRRVINREHVRLVDPSADWEELNPRVFAHQQRKIRGYEMMKPGVPAASSDLRGKALNRPNTADPDYTPPPYMQSSGAENPHRLRSRKRSREEGVDERPTKRVWTTRKRPRDDDSANLQSPGKRYKGHMFLRSHKPTTQEQEQMQIDAISYVSEFLQP